jgi:cyclopropane-fatty-acyl-phospholipid synthase
MGLFSLEQGPALYRADYVFYGFAVAALAGLTWAELPPAHGAQAVACVALGAAGWTLAEYALHRFVLHGLQPFSRWHAEHHARPTALISAPTLLSASLIIAFVFVPVLALAGAWPACALTFGVLTGYLAYAVTHHAVHHWHGQNAWLLRRKRWHALHHGTRADPGHYGVTTGVWDRVFATAGPKR